MTFCFPSRALLTAAVLATGALVAACDSGSDRGASLYKPGTSSGTKPSPTLTGISPAAGQALAGVTTLTLTGTNFNPSKDSTFVYFNGQRVPAANIVSISPTQIVLKAPNQPVSGLAVKVSVLGASDFGTLSNYALLPAVERLGNTGKTEQLLTMTSDRAGNAYVSLLLGNIRRLTAAGDTSTYVKIARTYAGLAWSNTETRMMAVRGVRATFTFNGNAEATYGVAPSGNFIAIDVDDDGNTWAGGLGATSFYRITPAKVVTAVPLPTTSSRVTAIEVRSDAAYVAVVDGASSKVYRYPITGTTVGAPAVYVDLAAYDAGALPSALAFDAAGTLYIGTNLVQSPILTFKNGTLAVLYPGLMQLDPDPANPVAPYRDARPVCGLSWGTGGLLYAACVEAVAIKASTDTPGDLLKITTLQTAEH